MYVGTEVPSLWRSRVALQIDPLTLSYAECMQGQSCICGAHPYCKYRQPYHIALTNSLAIPCSKASCLPKAVQSFLLILRHTIIHNGFGWNHLLQSVRMNSASEIILSHIVNDNCNNDKDALIPKCLAKGRISVIQLTSHFKRVGCLTSCCVREIAKMEAAVNAPYTVVL